MAIANTNEDEGFLLTKLILEVDGILVDRDRCR